MSFKTKHWTAQIDRTPGNQSFRVNATVTVEDPRALVRLELSTVQDNPLDLRLDLIISKPMDTALQGETEKLVTFEKMGDSNVTSVSIFYEGKLFFHIHRILTTH